MIDDFLDDNGLFKFWEVPEIKPFDYVSKFQIPIYIIGDIVDFVNINNLNKTVSDIKPKKDSLILRLASFLLSAPDNPVIIQGIDSLYYNGEFFSKNDGLNILYCHGNDGKNVRTPPFEGWVFSRPKKDLEFVTIPDVLKAIKEDSYNIDLVFSCNEGSYSLPKELESVIYAKKKVWEELGIFGKHSYCCPDEPLFWNGEIDLESNLDFENVWLSFFKEYEKREDVQNLREN